MEAEAPDAANKPRVSNACEACRAAKVKCQPSNTLGICRRCLDSRRECIFKTGPRTRRPRQSRQNAASLPRRSPPPGPSKTFTIDIPMPADEDVGDSIEALRSSHEAYISQLISASSVGGAASDSEFDYDDDENYDFSQQQQQQQQQQPSHRQPRRGGAATPASSSTSRTRSTTGFGIQPQFNLDSAAALLESFREGMLAHFPVIVLPEDATVTSLARDRPFVLLAILAAASGSRTIQGHSLYDEELRKVLGLKFVAGGERSLELLTGILIYCAWYPFHLRPKNRQALQYLRMAADIVHDLELDQEPESGDLSMITENEERMAGARAYLGCYYLGTSSAISWMTKCSVEYSPWTATCCEMLDANISSVNDRILSWLVRFEHLQEETAQLRKTQKTQPQSDYQTSLIIKGMEAQLNEWQSKIPDDISSTPPMRIGNFFTHFFLYGSPLLSFPAPRNPSLDRPGVRQDPERLKACVDVLRSFFDYVDTLSAADFACFCGIDWGHFIHAIILAFRLSFPLNICPDWDHDAARQTLDLGSWIDRFTVPEQNLVPASNKPTDINSASKIVLAIVKQKFDRRVAHLSPPHPMPAEGGSARNCPMLDGSMDPYLKIWDEQFTDPNSTILSGMGTGAPQEIYHDLWATMTMGWASDTNMGGFDMPSDIDFGNL